MSRYSTSNIIKDEDGKQRRATTIFPTIPATTSDTFIITTSSDRLDKLANIFYEDVSLWWVIAAANGLGKGTLFVPENTTIRIPVDRSIQENVEEVNNNR